MGGATRYLAGFVAAMPLLLAACTSFTPSTIDKDLLSAEVQQQLTRKLGTQAPTISCPNDLEPNVGATTTCLLFAPRGVTYNVTVTITKLEPGEAGNYDVGNALFDAKVADKPNP